MSLDKPQYIDPVSFDEKAGIYKLDPRIIEMNEGLAYAQLYRHYSGIRCSWHGYHNKAFCPKCSQPMQLMRENLFWASAFAMESEHKGWVDICRWTKDKCFPDFGTMLLVYNSVFKTKYKPQNFVPF